MCTACQNLIKAIDAYIAKAEANLAEQLKDAGFLEAESTVSSIADLEEEIAKVLETDSKKIVSVLQGYDDFVDFVKTEWPKLRDDDEAVKKLTQIFRKQFARKITELTQAYVAEIDSEILVDEVSHKTLSWVADWSGELSGLMKLSDNTVIERILSAGLKNGDGVQTVALQIQDSGLRDSQVRARRVAVTEMLRAHNVAGNEAIMQSPVVTMKMWRHSGVGNPPRENHVAMDGQKVNKNEAYILIGRDGGIYRPMYPLDSTLPAAETVNCRCMSQPIIDDSLMGTPYEERQQMYRDALADLNEDFDAQLDRQRMQELVDTGLFEWTPDGQIIQNAGVDNASQRGIISTGDMTDRNMAMGLRTSPLHILSDDEIESVLKDAKSLGIPESILAFNEGSQTGFSDRKGVIYIRGDVLPDMSSVNNRDRLTQKAVLAHEYYGHYQHDPTDFLPGDWRDEFRASYRAALDAPGLSDDERRGLMQDAYDRAKEAGVSVTYNKEARKIIYGYD